MIIGIEKYLIRLAVIEFESGDSRAIKRDLLTFH